MMETAEELVLFWLFSSYFFLQLSHASPEMGRGSSFVVRSSKIFLSRSTPPTSKEVTTAAIHKAILGSNEPPHPCGGKMVLSAEESMIQNITNRVISDGIGAFDAELCDFQPNTSGLHAVRTRPSEAQPELLLQRCRTIAVTARLRPCRRTMEVVRQTSPDQASLITKYDRLFLRLFSGDRGSRGNMVPNFLS